MDPQNVITSLPSLRETVEHYGLSAQKKLGQHFLLDMNITRKIAKLSGACASDHVIEVGPGPGGLTRALLETGAKVTTIERDERCREILTSLQKAWPSQLNSLNKDALHTDYNQLIDKNYSTKFVSNLPYNISTELLITWLCLPSHAWSQMTLMFQKEVADRILAPHGNKTYGRLSILAQSAAIPQRGYDLPARAFTPPPKIDSTVVTFIRPHIAFPHIRILEALTRAAFSQRRKMIRTTLKPIFGTHLEKALQAIDLKPTARAEEISVTNYQILARIAVELNVT